MTIEYIATKKFHVRKIASNSFESKAMITKLCDRKRGESQRNFGLIFCRKEEV